MCDETLSIGGKANLADYHLYETNPMLSAGFNASFILRFPKSYLNWMVPGKDFKYTQPTISYDVFPIFPQVESWEVSRKKTLQ